MKWIVVQDYIHGQLMYMVENSETGERRMTTDWQSIAEQFAKEFGNEWQVHLLNDGDSVSL